MKENLLIIDDDSEFISDFSMLLSDYFECKVANSGDEGINIIKNNSIDVILLDLMFEGGPNGISILKRIKKLGYQIPVIMITDHASVETIVEAMKNGAYDYVSKTPNLQELLIKIKKSIDENIFKLKSRSIQSASSEDFFEIIGKSKAIEKLKKKISLYATNNNTVLITGESGVGKELVARQIHLQSNLKDEPFVAVNCAAIPKELLESELFGHEKGAFTGAYKLKLGKFELASPGTIFLDEISELSLDAQVKLLRVIQNRAFERVGGVKTISTTARIIAATNKNLRKLIDEEKFRDDLFYRLDVLPIEVPPLRERKEDIPLLIDHFTVKICTDLKIGRKEFSSEAVRLLMEYSWPGNIRELQNHLTRAIITSERTVVESSDLDSIIAHRENLSGYKPDKIPETWEEMDFMRKEAADKVSRDIEKMFLENLLEKHNGNIAKAAKSIGMNRSSLYKMIKKSLEV